jgi:hypothetical protein
MDLMKLKKYQIISDITIQMLEVSQKQSIKSKKYNNPKNTKNLNLKIMKITTKISMAVLIPMLAECKQFLEPIIKMNH